MQTHFPTSWEVGKGLSTSGQISGRHINFFLFTFTNKNTTQLHNISGCRSTAPSTSNPIPWTLLPPTVQELPFSGQGLCCTHLLGIPVTLSRASRGVCMWGYCSAPCANTSRETWPQAEPQRGRQGEDQAPPLLVYEHFRLQKGFYVESWKPVVLVQHCDFSLK